MTPQPRTPRNAGQAKDLSRRRRDQGPRTVLFVCTGNICRSPMAEYLLRDRLGKGSGWVVASAGTMAGRGMPASRAGIQVLAERGIDLSPHRSRPLTAREARQADVIVVMAESHRQQVTHLYPDVAPNVFMLKHFDPGSEGDVEDPIGASSSMYRLIRDEIEAALPGLLAFLETLE